MKVDTMRFVDKWFGIPLTFLFSIPLWLIETLFFLRRKDPDIRRTLFIELSEMGSAILVDPAMRRLHLEGESELFFAIFKDNYKSLKILGTIPESNIFKMRSDNLINLAMDVFRFIFWCRKKKITAAIDLELFSRFTALLTGFSGARTRIGFSTFHDEGMYRGSILNFPVRYNPHVHISINFISLVNRALNRFNNHYATIPVEKTEITLERAAINENEKEAVKSQIKDLYPDFKNERIVLLNANASDLLPQRRWPPENFIETGKVLLEKFDDILVVATGAPKEREYVQNVVNGIANNRCVNSAGVFEFEELIPLYSISTTMLTNDSGPAHFASVTSLKVFVIFGPETPALYGPLGNADTFYLGLPCSPCVSAANHRKTTCLTRPCVTGISPDWVTKSMVQYLTDSE